MGAAVPGLHSCSPALVREPFAAVASCVCSGRNWLRLPLRRGDGVKWTGRAGSGRHCPSVCSSALRVDCGVAEVWEGFSSNASIPVHGENGGEEVVTQSRRNIVQAGAALAFLAALNPSAVLAETVQSEPGAAASQGSAQAETKPEKSGVDMESWYRVRGEGFALSVPPNYEDIVEYDDSGNSLYGERAKEKTFLARFASPDRKEVLSVIARNSTQLKLSFLQVDNL
ncbi:hypothetical protein KC19_3G164900 [Ceratodon purpureus]|uniref:PsbP C-terminal domain-containing protein n=1 Tax=Ceratodon purpureus TaxID=3225 RepID=A0A8T0ILM4_CERPU|nr:hypothetical protein KC19_3G164900 [Ceratodon purpureus]